MDGFILEEGVKIEKIFQNFDEEKRELAQKMREEGPERDEHKILMIDLHSFYRKHQMSEV